MQWDKILFEILGRTWRVDATNGSPKRLLEVGERFVTEALKFCSKKYKNYIKPTEINLETLFDFQRQIKPAREVYESEGYWQYPPSREVAIMICGDSKLVADYACGVTRISNTNKYRLGAAFEILCKLWCDELIVSSHKGAKFVRHISREINTEADVMADYGRRRDHLASFRNDTLTRPKFLLAKFDGSVRVEKMGSGWVLYTADKLDVNDVPCWVPSAAGCVAMPGVAASVVVSEIVGFIQVVKAIRAYVTRVDFMFSANGLILNR